MSSIDNKDKIVLLLLPTLIVSIFNLSSFTLVRIKAIFSLKFSTNPSLEPKTLSGSAIESPVGRDGAFERSIT